MEGGANENRSGPSPAETSSAQPAQPTTPVAAQLLPGVPPPLTLHQVAGALPQTPLVVPNMSPAQWQMLLAAQAAQHAAALGKQHGRTRAPLAPKMVQEKGPVGKEPPIDQEKKLKTEKPKHVYRLLVAMAMKQLKDDSAKGKDWRTKFEGERERNTEIAKVIEEITSENPSIAGGPVKLDVDQVRRAKKEMKKLYSVVKAVSKRTGGGPSFFDMKPEDRQKLRDAPGGKYAALPVYDIYPKQEYELADEVLASDAGVDSIYAVNQNTPPSDLDPATAGSKHKGAAAQQQLFDLLKENFEERRELRAQREAEHEHEKEERKRERDARWIAMQQGLSEMLQDRKEQAEKRTKKDEEMLEVLKAMVNRLSS